MSIHDDMLEYNVRNKRATTPTFTAEVGTLVSEAIVFKNVTLSPSNGERTNVVGKIIPTISGEFEVSNAETYDDDFDVKDKNGVLVSDGSRVDMKAFNEYTLYTSSHENVTKDIEVVVRFLVQDVTNYIIKG